MDVKGIDDEGSKGSKEHIKESLYHLREYLYCHKQNFGWNVNIKSMAGEYLAGSEKHVIGDWRKGGTLYNC